MKAASYDAEGRVRLERGILGALLEEPSLWKDASGLTADKFLLTLHRKVFSAIQQLNEDGQCADIVSVSAWLGEKIEAAELSVLVENGVPANFQAYIRGLDASLRDRKFDLLKGRLDSARRVENRREILAEMQEVLATSGDGQNWRGIFHTQEELENAPPLTFAIHGFLQEAGVTLVAGLAGQGKTWIMLSMAKALLEESHLFGDERFPVTRKSQRVVYLIPESSIGPFWARVKMFHLEEFARSDRLLIRTLSSREQIELMDPRMLAAIEGSDIFLDSVVRFTTGSENDAESIRIFSDEMFRLLGSGAKTIVGCHHSPKSFESAQFMSLENILRGSTDLGAMPATVWGVRQIDPARNRIYVENCKSRDFQPCPPFIIEGRPHLDQAGQFQVVVKPGDALPLADYLQSKGGRPVAPDREAKIAEAWELRNHGKKNREIARILGVSHTTVNKWLGEQNTGTDEEI